jgi:hypothetical protein
MWKLHCLLVQFINFIKSFVEYVNVYVHFFCKPLGSMGLKILCERYEDIMRAYLRRNTCKTVFLVKV